MKCGILLENLTPSQTSFFFVNCANQMMASSQNICFTFFLDDILPAVIQPLCAIMNSNEISQFNDGAIITTTIGHTLQAIKQIHNSKIKFYVLDLEWLRKPSNYFYNILAFRDDRVEVIARSHDHAKIIANYANIPLPKVVENNNLMEILNVTTN